MTNTIVSATPAAVNPLEFHIGLAVRVQSTDSFNGMAGVIGKIVHGNAPAFYVALDASEYRHDLMYFAADELIAQPMTRYKVAA